MQPDANRSRALAMSVRGVSTFTPTASIDTTSDFTDVEQQIEVVNHQVEDDVDVQAALRKRAEPVDLDETRIRHERQRRDHRRIEPLRMPGRQHRCRARAAASISRSASASDDASGFSTSTAIPAR